MIPATRSWKSTYGQFLKRADEGRCPKWQSARSQTPNIDAPAKDLRVLQSARFEAPYAGAAAAPPRETTVCPFRVALRWRYRDSPPRAYSLPVSNRHTLAHTTASHPSLQSARFETPLERVRA